ncbi:MAG: NUDIX domain-containing protein [Actinomycetota bacterium]
MKSAGFLPYRHTGTLEVLIAHPGGPFWANKDEGAWSVVKGLVESGEEPREAAAREFAEETGWEPPPGPWVDLGEVRLRSGKVVAVWSAPADYDPATLRPEQITTTIRGRTVTIPEIDRVAWFDLETAGRKLNPAYGPVLERLERVGLEAGWIDRR